MATRTTPTTRAARTKQPPPSDYVLIPIDAIDVGERYRGDPNKDLDTLAASIDKLGQLQPIVVTPPTDGRYDLLAGLRRLMAMRDLLGMDEIDAHIVHNLDEAHRLLVEHNENVCRVQWPDRCRSGHSYHHHGPLDCVVGVGDW